MVLDEPKSEDIVKEINGIKVCFDDMAKNYAEGLVLDNEAGNFMLTNQYSSC